MKTSNIIITAFAILIMGAITFLYVDSKRHVEEVKDNITYKEFPLSAFKVIVAEFHSDIHIDHSDNTLIKIEYVKGVKVPSKLYEVINDTLHVYGGLRTFVKCKQITQIIGNKPFWVGVGNFAPDSLTIKMTGGQFSFNKEFQKTYKLNTKAVNMKIIANDSAYVEIANARLNNLTVKSDNAVVNNYCDTKHLNAKLINKTRFFNFNNIETLALERDTTSHVQINNENYNFYR